MWKDQQGQYLLRNRWNSFNEWFLVVKFNLEPLKLKKANQRFPFLRLHPIPPKRIPLNLTHSVRAWNSGSQIPEDEKLYPAP
jgi:hypothetical protein